MKSSTFDLGLKQALDSVIEGQLQTDHVSP